MSDNIERRSYDREIGDLSARMTNAEKWLASISDDVKAIRSAVDEGKGGWKMLVMLAGFCGALGAIIGRFLPVWGK